MTDDIPPVSAPEAVRVFRFKRQNVSLRGEVPNPPVTTLFMAFDPLPGTSYTGEDGRWLPVDAYDALVAENARLREALKQVDRALWDVIGCVEDLNDCEGWHGSDPHSRSGKLNDACAKARTALGAERAG